MKISDYFRLEKERKPIVLKDLTKFELYRVYVTQRDDDARVCGYDARPGWRNGGFFVVDVELDNDGSGDVALFFDPA